MKNLYRYTFAVNNANFRDVLEIECAILPIVDIDKKEFYKDETGNFIKMPGTPFPSVIKSKSVSNTWIVDSLEVLNGKQVHSLVIELAGGSYLAQVQNLMSEAARLQKLHSVMLNAPIKIINKDEK